MAVEQLLDEYKENGFEIKSQYPIIGSLRVDLFAVKGDERIAIEFVDNQTSDDTVSRLQQIAQEEDFVLKLIDISAIQLEYKNL